MLSLMVLTLIYKECDNTVKSYIDPMYLKHSSNLTDYIVIMDKR